MPLSRGSSKKAIGENIKRLLKENVPRRQAIAIALDVARKARAKTPKKGKI